MRQVLVRSEGLQFGDTKVQEGGTVRSGGCFGGSWACVCLNEATGDKRIQGLVIEWTECPRLFTGGSWYACGELRGSVYLGEEVCTSHCSGALGRLWGFRVGSWIPG